MQEIPSKKHKAKKEWECFRIYIIYRGPILASTRLQYQKKEDECSKGGNALKIRASAQERSSDEVIYEKGGKVSAFLRG